MDATPSDGCRADLDAQGEAVSRDGRLPDDVSEARFDEAFPPDCLPGCVSMRECLATCGGCACHVLTPCTHCTEHVPGDCDCAERKDDAKADAAEARSDRERDR